MTEFDLLMQLGQDIQNNFFETIISPFVDTLSLPIAALMIFGSIGLAYYQLQKSIIIPIIMLVLIGGTTLSRAPESAANAVVGLTVLALAAVSYVAYVRVRER
jgi:ribose/xylose/arabinose/galactoside ABC-type transport system permease subunit